MRKVGQQHSQIAFDYINERYIVLWRAGSDLVLGQLIARDGELWEENFTAIAPGVHPNRPKAVVFDSLRRRFLAVIQTFTDPTSNLCGQFLASDGSADGDSFPITTFTAGMGAVNSAVAHDYKNRRVLVAYGSSDLPEIRAVALSLDDGSFLAEEASISSTDTQFGRPSVAFDEFRERFLVTWHLNGQLTTGGGLPIGETFALADVNSGNAYDAVFDVGNEAYLVVGRNLEGEDSVNGIYLYPDGNRAGEVFEIDQHQPGEIYAAAGPRAAGVFIAWRTGQFGDADVIGKFVRFAASGGGPCQELCDALWNITWFSCDHGHDNEFILQPDGSPVCGNENCPGPDCWQEAVVAREWNSGEVSWQISASGAIALQHERDVQVRGETWLRSHSQLLAVPVSADVGSVWLNGGAVATRGGLLLLGLTEGWNHLVWTSYNQNQATRFAVSWDFLSSVSCMTSTSPEVELTLEVEPEGAGQTVPAIGKHRYECGSTVEIAATPMEGWQFDRWEGGVEEDPKDPVNSVSLALNKTLRAVFSSPLRCRVEQTDLESFEVIITNTVPIKGGEIGLCYDAATVNLISVEEGPDFPSGDGVVIAALDPVKACSAEDPCAAGLTVKWSNSQTQSILTPEGASRLVRIHFVPAEGANAISCSPLRFVRCLGDPSVRNTVVDEHDETVPLLTTDGEICLPMFRRGDANGDGQYDISDAIGILSFLFLGASAPPCMDGADVNDDGKIDVSDAVSFLAWRFLGGTQPAPPYPECGHDPTTDELTCESYAPCE